MEQGVQPELFYLCQSQSPLFCLALKPVNGVSPPLLSSLPQIQQSVFRGKPGELFPLSPHLLNPTDKCDTNISTPEPPPSSGVPRSSGPLAHGWAKHSRQPPSSGPTQNKQSKLPNETHILL